MNANDGSRKTKRMALRSKSISVYFSVASSPSPVQLNTDDVLTFLTIAAVVLLLILMYHLIFIAVNLRKITKNLSEVTDEIEDVVMKPLSFLNEAFGWLMLLASQFQDDEDTPKKKKRD